VTGYRGEFGDFGCLADRKEPRRFAFLKSALGRLHECVSRFSPTRDESHASALGTARTWVAVVGLERATGIEPMSRAWRALVLPLNYTRPSILLSRFRFNRLISRTMVLEFATGLATCCTREWAAESWFPHCKPQLTYFEHRCAAVVARHD
jgi:hypothetical protein